MTDGIGLTAGLVSKLQQVCVRYEVKRMIDEDEDEDEDEYEDEYEDG